MQALKIGNLPIAAPPNEAPPMLMPNMKRRPANSNVDDVKQNIGALMPLLFNGCSSTDDMSSDEKPRPNNAKIVDEEAGIEKKDDRSDSEDSQPDENSKMLDHVTEKRRNTYNLLYNPLDLGRSREMATQTSEPDPNDPHLMELQQNIKEIIKQRSSSKGTQM